MAKIRQIKAREILDSRGYPTIETKVTLESGNFGVASVPSGASTGSFEAVELRDGGARFFGKGVLTAITNVNEKIAPMLAGTDAENQAAVDSAMLDLDGTENKSHLGANAVLSVSLAACKAAASYHTLPLYRYLGGILGTKPPKPMMNILNGGVHADNRIDIQEFMIIPTKEATFKEYVLMCVTVYHNLKKTLKESGYNVSVGDEGGVAPDLSHTHEALDMIMKAIETSGYKPGSDMQIALDVAASEFYKDGLYHIDGLAKTSDQMVEFYQKLVNEYPIISIEDPFAESDWNGFVNITKEIGQTIQIVGDDLFVTNKKRLKMGIDSGTANAVLIKLNQIGTVTETLEAVALAKENAYNVIISHRSGETIDTSISDLAVAVSAQYIKTGAPARGERVAKYNRLLQIEEELEIFGRK
jgi:enolase